VKPATRPHTVLLVEDDALNLELLQAVLEGRGFVVLAAADAPTGIDMARRERPDCVLMDVQLPDMDGLEATRRLRADASTAHIPIIAVTAHVKKDDEQRCLAAGCVLHLSKPVDTRSLADVVTRVIESAQAGTANAGHGEAKAKRAASPALRGSEGP
jgi:two-component system cell cycle response regulator DivK